MVCLVCKGEQRLMLTYAQISYQFWPIQNRGNGHSCLSNSHVSIEIGNVLLDITSSFYLYKAC